MGCRQGAATLGSMAEEEQQDVRAPAERVIQEGLIDPSGIGKPLKRREVQRQRSVESYLRGEVLPRYITRLRELERSLVSVQERLAAARADLRAHHADDAAFQAAWDARVEAWDFSAHNDLVEQHNRNYPIERDLPMDPRTGDYVQVGGRDFRRPRLDAAWARRVAG